MDIFEKIFNEIHDVYGGVDLDTDFKENVLFEILENVKQKYFPKEVK